MDRRNTIQRDLVLEAVRKLGNHATADEVYAFVSNKFPSIGKGTVYRNLNILAEDGVINKIEDSNGPERFDHLTHMHYHMKCDSCGRFFDVDMQPIDGLEKKINNTCGFIFSGYDIVFRGICKDCQEKDKKENDKQ